MSRPNAKSNGILVWAILYFPICWFALALAGKWIDGTSLIGAIAIFQQIMDNPLDITINEYTLKFVLIISSAYLLVVLYIKLTAANTRHGEEHGSSKWGNISKCSRKYKQNPQTDRIISANFRMGLNARKHRRNNNTLVIGASGSGKTRFYAKPNVLQCNTSFVITDPKGGATRSQLKRLRTRLHLYK